MELGSGDGKMLRTLHAARPTLDLHGCDIRAPRTETDCYRFHPLPLSSELDGSFDAVVIMDVLEHVRDPAATLADAARLLKPGARLVAFVPVEGERLSAYTLFRKLLGDDVYVETKDHVQAFSHDRLASLLRSQFVVHERKYAYHVVGQSMDAGFFAAQRLGKLRELWRSENSFYNPDKEDATGAAGVMNALLRAGNAIAWAESLLLRDVQFGSAGQLLVAVARS